MSVCFALAGIVSIPSLIFDAQFFNKVRKLDDASKDNIKFQVGNETKEIQTETVTPSVQDR
jgi:hypothetical protein